MGPRVLLIATSLAQTSQGGATFLVSLLSSLRSVGVDLVIAAPESSLETIQRHAPDVVVQPANELTGWRRILRDLVMPRYWTKLHGVDIVVYPHEFAPLGGGRKVIVIQNVGPFDYTSRAEFGTRGRLLRWLSAWRLGGADAIVAVSHNALGVWESAVGTSEAKKYVIPEAFVPPAIEWRDRVQSYPPGRIVFVLGEWDYKNVGPVQAALETALDTISDDPELRVDIRVAGVEEFETAHAVEVLGKLPRQGLLNEFASADLVVFPSAVEAFGLPALEAACMGVKPAVLKNTAMEEWLGSSCIAMSSLRLDLAHLILSVASGHTYRMTPQQVSRIRNSFSTHAVGRQWSCLLEALAVGGN